MRLKPTIVLGRPVDRLAISIHIALRSTNCWIIFVHLSLLLTAYQYCNLHFYNDPTWFFFDTSKIPPRVYSLQREKQAGAFIESRNRSIDVISPSSNASICLGLATVARSGEQYARKTIGSLFEGLSKHQRSDIHFMVLFAQTDPASHPIFVEHWL